MVYQSLESFPKDSFCNLCKTREVDPISLGYIYKCGNIIVHYFCLLLASKGVQRGTDKQGILGFLPKDIESELKRGSRIKCHYCHKRGATVLCSKNRCKVNFHLPCGLKANSLHCFRGSFKSVCFKHRTKRVIPNRIKRAVIENQSVCILCFETVDMENMTNLIWPPCCKPTSLQHKHCVQRMAYSAGYYFKCPLCANTTKYIKAMTELGIYVPDQDAAWESEPGAFDELYQTPICNADHCSCPKGVKYNKNGTKWHLKSCSLCGSWTVHEACMNLHDRNTDSQLDLQCPNCAWLRVGFLDQKSSITESTALDVRRTNYDSRMEVDSHHGVSNSTSSSVAASEADDSNSMDRLVYYSRRDNEIAAPDQKNADGPKVLYVDDSLLSTAMKNVADVVEIIVNGKRCHVRLTDKTL